MALFLQGISFVGGAEHLKLFGLHLHGLALALRLHKLALHMDGRAGGHGLELLIAELGHIKDHLEIADGGAVVKGHKLHVFVAAAGAHPAHHVDGRVELGLREYGRNLCTFHIKY